MGPANQPRNLLYELCHAPGPDPLSCRELWARDDGCQNDAAIIDRLVSRFQERPEHVSKLLLGLASLEPFETDKPFLYMVQLQNGSASDRSRTPPPSPAKGGFLVGFPLRTDMMICLSHLNGPRMSQALSMSHWCPQAPGAIPSGCVRPCHVCRPAPSYLGI